MKKLVTLAIIIVLAYGALQNGDFAKSQSPVVEADNRTLLDAQARQQSDVQLTGHGIVTRILPDDLQGSRHQRFILNIGSDRTVLVSHNIDLAQRVEGLQKGDKVEFSGEYEWNSKGGVVHWTHHDPAGRHPGGWLQHQGNIYE